MSNRFVRGLKLAGLSSVCLARALAAKAGLHINPPEPGSGEALSFVIYSITPWSDVWQRPQHFATRLAEKYPVIYLDPYGLQHVIADDAGTTPVLTRIHDNLHVFRPRVLPGGKVNSRIVSLNDAKIVRELTRIFKKLNFSQPVLVTNTPLTDEIAELYPWKSVVYDVIDDFVANNWAPPDAVEREIRLLKQADTVFTGTYSLWEKKRPFHPAAEFFPCGVEVDHFLKANDPDLLLPEDIRDIPRPIAGYFGGLNDRIDHNLLVHLAESLPNISVVLLGPIFASFGLSDFEDKWASRLPSPDSPGFRLKNKPSNMHILGIKKYQDLPAYLKAFDVSLIPFDITDVTIDIHPVKILEYLAAGRPVVSTPLPDVKRFYQDIVAIADTPDEFVQCVKTYLDNDNAQSREERIEFARPKSWENMAENMVRKILEAPVFNPERNLEGNKNS